MAELTTEQVRENFLDYIRHLVLYWEHLPGIDESTGFEHTLKSKLEGVAFSILTLLDGGTGLPGFIVAPLPCKGDKEDCIQNEEDWYPENDELRVNCDIAGSLHEHFYNNEKK